jgi:hypothetical protein
MACVYLFSDEKYLMLSSQISISLAIFCLRLFFINSIIPPDMLQSTINMEKGETLKKGDILTPQEHIWMGSSPGFTPIKNEEWYIPDGVLRGKITLKEAIEERKGISYTEIMIDPLGIITHGSSEAMAMSLEDIDERSGQTKDDPKILGIIDDDSINPQPMINATGEVRDLTKEIVELYAKRGLEKDTRGGRNVGRAAGVFVAAGAVFG